MEDILGFTLKEALSVLGAQKRDKRVSVSETSGYRSSQDMTPCTDVRVVGIRETESEIHLITAKF